MQLCQHIVSLISKQRLVQIIQTGAPEVLFTRNDSGG